MSLKHLHNIYSAERKKQQQQMSLERRIHSQMQRQGTEKGLFCKKKTRIHLHDTNYKINGKISLRKNEYLPRN